MNPVPSADNSEYRLLSLTPTQHATISDISVVTNDNFHRYMSSELYLLRNDVLSRQRPECTLRTKLTSLSIWKPITVYQQNINGNVGGKNNGSGNNNTTSFISHINTRGQRSPCGRNNLISTEHSSQFGTHTQSTHTNQKNYVDHRTISSAHLMPAFAKRRIGVSSLVSSSLYDSSGKTSDITGNTSAEIGSDFQQSCRQRSKVKIQGRQHMEEDHLNPASLSQQINLDQFDKDRQEFSDSNHYGKEFPCTSSAFTSTRLSVVNSGSERRIGSGRLLHCDVNWDFRNADKDNKKGCSLVEKDSTAIPQRICARFNDREQDRPERLNFTEKRNFNRKHADVENRDKFESRNNSIHSNASISRRFVSNDMESNCVDIPEQHSVQSMRSNNHYYNEIKDEPEWFSGGPTSQHDTIELRGFEDLDEQSPLNNKNIQRKFRESSSRANSITNLISSKLEDLPKELNDTITAKGSEFNAVFSKVKGDYVNDSTLITNNQQRNDSLINNDKNGSNARQFLKSSYGEKEEVKCDTKKNSQLGLTDFNFDAFLNMDPLTHSLMGTNVKVDEELDTIANSRFSRWFVSKNNLSDSSNRIMPQHAEKKNKFNDSCDIRITEIDGLHSTSVPPESSKQANTLMQFLQRSKLPSALKEVQPHGCIPSVEELEARMRQICSAPGSNIIKESKPSSCNVQNSGVQLSKMGNSQVPITQQDTEAFKKLLEQLSSANRTDLQDSRTAIELQKGKNQQRSSLNISQNVNNNFPMPRNEEFNQLIQHQFGHQQQHSQLVQNQRHNNNFPMPQNEEINQLMHNQFVRQQHSQLLQNQQSNLQQQNQSLVELSSHIPNIAYEKPRYELNLLQGMPCVRDTQFCAQNSALKEKLQDYESFKRRQEIQNHSSLPNPTTSGPKSAFYTEISQNSFHRHHHHQLKHSNGLCQQLSPQNPQPLQTWVPQHFSDNPSQSQHQRVINSPTPLAFTPTSVLRKMTAEKENSSLIPSTQHQQAANQMHMTNSFLPLRPHLQIHTQTTNKTIQSVISNQQHHQQHQQHQHPLIPPQSHHQVSIINPQQQIPREPRMILGGGSNPQIQQIQLNTQQIFPQQTLQQQPHSLGAHLIQQSQRPRSNQQQLKWQVPPILNQHPTKSEYIKMPIKSHQISQ